MPAERQTPVCKISVDGTPLGIDDQARLIKATVELDPDLFSQTTLLFMDPEMELIDGTLFEAGKAVELKLGYDAKAPSVFRGEVVALEPQFRRDEPVALKVVCQDSMHRLALSPRTRAFNNADLSAVVNTIAQEHGLAGDAPSGTPQHILQSNVSDAAFLKKYAARLGMRVRIEDKKLSFGVLPNTTPIPLALGDGVKKLKVKRKAVGQVGEVSVHGWDEKTKQEVVGKAKPKGATGKGAKDYGQGTLSDSSAELMPPDQQTAEDIAKARMQKIAEGYATLQAELIGDGRYLPGQVVELEKLGPGIDGTYRIERARHEFNRHGYYVKFDAVWTGPKKLPKAPKPAQPPYTPPTTLERGKLQRPRWARRSSGGSDVAGMSVDAPGKVLDGKGVTFILETKIGGGWKEVARADGTIANGFANATAPLSPIAPADVLSEPKWTAAKDGKHDHGEKGEVSIKSKVTKPHDVRLILEQQLASGRVWEMLDWQLVKVQGGVAKATFDLEHPHHEEAAKKHALLLKTPVWDQKPPGVGGGAGLLTVAAPGLEDGRKVKFLVERLGRDGKWSTIKTAQAIVARGSAAALLDLQHTSRKPPPDDADQLETSKAQGGEELGEAEHDPRTGAATLRFRAEPVADLRPRKLRFRTEVPVPESPALTRLRVELKGGTPDDHVQTSSSS